MAIFVHLTPAAAVPRLRRSGIRAGSRHRDGGPRGVHCFPVLPSYTLTHQWLRELARFGAQGPLVAVHLRLPDGEPVLAGHYSPRRSSVSSLPAAEAVRLIASLDDPRGWEVFVPRAIRPREIHAVRGVPQVVGWRYQPDAHGTPPCTCHGCRIRGGYGARRLRERLPHPEDGPPPPPRILLARIAAAGPSGDPALLRDTLRWFAHRRRGPLPQLTPLASHPDPTVREALVWSVAHWTTPGVPALLAALSTDPDACVREAVTWSLPPDSPTLDRLAADPDPDVREAVASVREPQ